MYIEQSQPYDPDVSIDAIIQKTNINKMNLTLTQISEPALKINSSYQETKSTWCLFLSALLLNNQLYSPHIPLIFPSYSAFVFGYYLQINIFYPLIQGSIQQITQIHIPIIKKQMQFEFWETLGHSQQDDFFQIELSENRKKMLEHYQQTGQILTQNNDRNSTPARQSSFIRKSKKEHRMLSRIDEVDEQYLQSMCNVDEMGKVNNQSESQIQAEKENTQQGEPQLTKYQKFIVTMMLQLRLINQTDQNIYVMLQKASENYLKRIQTGQNLNNIQRSAAKTIFPNGENDLKQIKQSAADQLTEYMNILVRNQSYKKYCYYTYKVQKINASFAFDFKHFVYRVGDKEGIRAENMADYKGHILGKSSKNFKKYLKKGESSQDSVSFSLIFNNRTLDLQSECAEQRNIFIAALKQLQKYL